jgi:hypothetical protein
MDNAKSYHVAGIYYALAWLMMILPYDSPTVRFVTNVISFLLILGGTHILVALARRHLTARRLRRTAPEAGSEGDEGLDMDWLSRPL